MNLEKYLNDPLPIEKELKYYLQNKKIVIFDVGCCEGEDTIRYSNLFPESIIYSFEPHPDNFKKTIFNLEKYRVKNSKVFNFALSNLNSSIDFYLSEGHPPDLPSTGEWNYGNKSSSIFPPKELHEKYEWLRLKNKIKVDSITIDKFCEENNIKNIDLLHLDVQGAEILVLEGSKNMIDEIGLIWLEAEIVELYENQPLKDNVVDFLASNFEKVKEIDNYLSCDMLFINKKLKK